MTGHVGSLNGVGWACSSPGFLFSLFFYIFCFCGFNKGLASWFCQPCRKQTLATLSWMSWDLPWRCLLTDLRQKSTMRNSARQISPCWTVAPCVPMPLSKKARHRWQLHVGQDPQVNPQIQWFITCYVVYKLYIVSHPTVFPATAFVPLAKCSGKLLRCEG